MPIFFPLKRNIPEQMKENSIRTWSAIDKSQIYFMFCGCYSVFVLTIFSFLLKFCCLKMITFESSSPFATSQCHEGCCSSYFKVLNTGLEKWKYVTQRLCRNVFIEFQFGTKLWSVYWLSLFVKSWDFLHSLKSIITFCMLVLKVRKQKLHILLRWCRTTSVA